MACNLYGDVHYGSVHTLPGGIVMATGILSEFALISGLHAKHPAPHGNDPADLGHATLAGGAIPRIRMQLLHFENAFGDVCTSEYCLDAMLSLVLLMMRSSRHDAARVERLTEAANAPYPADCDMAPLSRAVRR